MKQDDLIERITLKPEILAGKPVIRGTRLSVQYILGLLAQGETTQDILNEYDGLTEEDVKACLLFATKSLDSVDFMPLAGEMS